MLCTRKFATSIRITVLVAAVTFTGVLLLWISSVQTKENRDQLEILETTRDPRVVRRPQPPLQHTVKGDEASSLSEKPIKIRERENKLIRHKREAQFVRISGDTGSILKQQRDLPLEILSKSDRNSFWVQRELQTSQQKEKKSGPGRLNWAMKINISFEDSNYADKETRIKNNASNNTYLGTVVVVEGTDQLKENNFFRAWNALSRFLNPLFLSEELSRRNVVSSPQGLPESFGTISDGLGSGSDDKRNLKDDPTKEVSQEKMPELRSLNSKLGANGSRISGQIVNLNAPEAAIGERKDWITSPENLKNLDDRKGRLFNWFSLRKSGSASASIEQKVSTPNVSQIAQKPIIPIIGQIKAGNTSNGCFQSGECNDCPTECKWNNPVEMNETQNLESADECNSEAYEQITEPLADDCECEILSNNENRNSLVIASQDKGDSFSPEDGTEVLECDCEDQSNFSNQTPSEGKKIALSQDVTIAGTSVSLKNETHFLALFAEFCFKQILPDDKLKELSDSFKQRIIIGKKQINLSNTYVDSPLLSSKTEIENEKRSWNDSIADDRLDDQQRNEIAQIFVSTLRKGEHLEIAEILNRTFKFINFSGLYDFFGSGSSGKMAGDKSDPEISFNRSNEFTTGPPPVQVVQPVDPKCVSFFRDVLYNQHHINKTNLVDVIELAWSEISKAIAATPSATGAEMTWEEQLIENKPNLKLNTNLEHPNSITFFPSSNLNSSNQNAEHALGIESEKFHLQAELSKENLISLSVENVGENETHVHEKLKKRPIFGSGRDFNLEESKITFEDRMFLSGTKDERNVQNYPSTSDVTRNRWFLGSIIGSGENQDLPTDAEGNYTQWIDLGTKKIVDLLGNGNELFTESTSNESSEPEASETYGKSLFEGISGSGERRDALGKYLDTATVLVNQSERRFFDIPFGSGNTRDMNYEQNTDNSVVNFDGKQKERWFLGNIIGSGDSRNEPNDGYDSRSNSSADDLFEIGINFGDRGQLTNNSVNAFTTVNIYKNLSNSDKLSAFLFDTPLEEELENLSSLNGQTSSNISTSSSITSSKAARFRANRLLDETECSSPNCKDPSSGTTNSSNMITSSKDSLSVVTYPELSFDECDEQCTNNLNPETQKQFEAVNVLTDKSLSIAVESYDIFCDDCQIEKANVSSGENSSLSVLKRFCIHSGQCSSLLNERCIAEGSDFVCGCGGSQLRHPLTNRCQTKLVLGTSLRFPNEIYDKDFKDHRSKKFTVKKKEAEYTMRLLLEKSALLQNSVTEVDVTDFSPGSLLIKWSLVIAVPEHETLAKFSSQLERVLKESLKDEVVLKKIPLNGSQASVLKVYQAMCSDDYCLEQGVCELKYGEPVCVCTSWFVGEECQISGIVVVVGTTLGNAAIVLLVIFCFCFLKRRRDSSDCGESRDCEMSRMANPTLRHYAARINSGLENKEPTRLERTSPEFTTDTPQIVVIPPSMSDYDLSFDSSKGSCRNADEVFPIEEVVTSC